MPKPPRRVGGGGGDNLGAGSRVETTSCGRGRMMTIEAELPSHGSERGKILKQCRNQAKKTSFYPAFEGLLSVRGKG
jgi:hypothetical protein